MIDQLAEILRAAGLDPTARELADALWLAAHLPPTEAPPLSARGGAPTGASSGEGTLVRPMSDPAAPPPSVRLPREPSADLFLPGKAAPARAAAAPIRTPAGAALPGKLLLGRALRPLKRRVPSRTRVELDEAETADRIAQGVRPTIALRPSTDRWLDLALVMEATPTMALWRRTLAELRALLACHGAFRDVRAYHFLPDADSGSGATQQGILFFAGAPSARAARGAAFAASDRPRPARPGELVDPSGRRLVLVVSDCVSPVWDSGAMGTWLEAWAQHGPVAVLQVLPRHLWRRTGLGAAEAVRLVATTPAAPSARLAVERLTALSMQGGEAAVLPLPVIELSATSVRAWARVLAADGGAYTAGVLLPVGGDDSVDGAMARPDETGDEPTAEQRVARFRALATPTARKLAALLSAAPLSLPVMRLILQAMLPGATQGHLAEVLLGGLMHEVEEGNGEEKGEVDPEEARFDFFDGVRDRLLDAASMDEATGVLACVSEYVTQHLGSALDFRAWLADPTAAGGAAEIAPADRPFARIGATVLRRLGGAYARLAERIVARCEDVRPGEGMGPRAIASGGEGREALEAAVRRALVPEGMEAAVRRALVPEGMEAAVRRALVPEGSVWRAVAAAILKPRKGRVTEAPALTLGSVVAGGERNAGVVEGSWSLRWPRHPVPGAPEPFEERGSFRCEVAVDLDRGDEIHAAVAGFRSDFFERLIPCVDIPAGSFLMGSPDDDPEAYDYERPQHRVRVSAFRMGVTPVTEAQYSAVLGRNRDSDANPDLPVTGVSWEDAVAFCNSLSRLAGRAPCYTHDSKGSTTWHCAADGFRLPREAEWEYACRAGTTTRYSFGDDAGPLDEYAWFSDNSRSKTHPVAKKLPNPWGLYDMHGNVFEWVWDESGVDGAKVTSDNDNDKVTIVSPPGGWRVVRGGSFWSGPRRLRSALRYWRGPGFRYRFVGFRCAVVVLRQP